MDEKRLDVLENMQICRFCLNSDGNLTNIYDPKNNRKNSVPLPLQLMACVAIEVFQHDGMPQLICDPCRNLTLQAYSFKTNCKKADDALKLFLATGNLLKPFTKTDFQNYLPKGVSKLRKVRDDVLPNKKIKQEQDQSDTDSQTTLIDTIKEQQHETCEEYEVRTFDNNELSLEMVASTSTSTSKSTTVQTTRTELHACTQCEKTFSVKQLLDLHVKTHQKQISAQPVEKTPERIGRFMCSYCDQCFPRREDLMAHTKRSHNKKKPFACEECGKCFVFKQGLERHLAIHDENKPHKCNYCEASFNSSIKLTRHVTSHAGLRPYPCKLCKRTFLLSHHLTRHMRSHYAAKSNNVQQIGQHKCDICSMSFRRKDSLINHSAIHSMVNLKCVICNTEFESAQAVKEHITTHLSGLPFPCEKCDYSFLTKKQLEEHEMKHAEMEYEEEIEKEVVEEARALGHVTAGSDNDPDDYEEYGGDHMGRGEDEDEEYQVEDEDTFSICNMNDSSIQLRRSERTPKVKEFADFLKDEIESEPEEEEQQQQLQQEVKSDSGAAQNVDTDEDSMVQSDGDNVIKPIFRTEGTRVYQRKTPIRRPNILKTIAADKVKTAPLSQINQPQVTTIENLGLTTKDLQNLPTEKFVDMKIGNKTVRVQKLVLTKEEMKAMAKEGKIRGNTVLIKNPGQLSGPLSNSLSKGSLNTSIDPSSSRATKTYHKKKTNDQEACNAPMIGRDSIIINDFIIDTSNIDASNL